MQTTYDPTMTMREARARYFDVNGFGDDGGYGKAWIDFKLGKLPMPLPNSPARVRAVRYHDLHHILTEYNTDIGGEFEISAWEIGAGCRGFAAAWALNLSGTLGGLITKPSRTFRAFVRGRPTQTLYGRDFEPLLDLSVDEARRATLINLPTGHPRPSDYLLLALVAMAGLVVGTVLLSLTLPLVPLGLLAGWRAKRKASSGK